MELIVGVNKGSILNHPRDDNRVDRAVNGPVVCTATPEGIVHLEPSPDGLTCDVIPVAAGTASYTTSADADITGTTPHPISGNVITIVVTMPAPPPTPEATHIESVEGPVVPQ